MNPSPLLTPAREFIGRALRSRIARASGIVLTANVLSGLMSFGALLLTIRHLEPGTFGILTVVLATMQLVGMLANVGLNETMVTMISRADAMRKPEEMIRNLSALFRARLVVLVVVVTGGVFLARPVAEGILHRPEMGVPLVLGILGAGGVSLCQFSTTLFQSTCAYGSLSAVVFVRFGAIFAALAVLAAFGTIDLNKALAVNVVAPFAAFGVGLCLAPVPIRDLIKPGSSKGAYSEIWKRSKWTFVFNLCSLFFTRLEIYLVMLFTTAVEVGIYGAALKLIGGVLLVEGVVRTVLFPEISRRVVTTEPSAAVRHFIVPLLLLAGVICAVGLAATPLVPLILGERYAAAAGIFPILLIARAMLIPLTPLSLLFFAADRVRAGAISGMMQLALIAVAGYLLIPSFGAAGAAWTHILVTTAASVYTVAFAWPYIKGRMAQSVVAQTAGLE